MFSVFWLWAFIFDDQSVHLIKWNIALCRASRAMLSRARNSRRILMRAARLQRQYRQRRRPKREKLQSKVTTALMLPPERSSAPRPFPAKHVPLKPSRYETFLLKKHILPYAKLFHIMLCNFKEQILTFEFVMLEGSSGQICLLLKFKIWWRFCFLINRPEFFDWIFYSFLNTVSFFLFFYFI